MPIYARKPKYNKKEKRQNYKFEQHKPDSSDEFVEKPKVESILYLSDVQKETEGWRDGQMIAENIYINKIP